MSLADVKQGSKVSRAMCLRHVMRHPVGFREYWVPKVVKRPYWGRYAFLPIILSLDQGDSLLAAGRGTGKSFAVLEPELVRQAIARKGEETLLTTFRQIHMRDRMERAIEYFETIPFFRMFLKRVNRSPSYHVQLHNSHNLYGISVGDDPEARMAQGKHASTILLEEAHQYPDRAFQKLEGAKDPQGCRMLMIGVPDGQIDTPFRNADTRNAAFEGRRVHISRRYDPWYDQATKTKHAETYKGLDTDLHKQEVDAEWGSPSWSAWSLDAIYACMESDGDLPKVFRSISGREYREQGFTPEMALHDLPGSPFDGEVILAADIGYTQPTEIGVWVEWKNRWWLIARIQLFNRTEHDDQAKIFAWLGRRYNASRIGLDTTEGLGRAIAAELELLPRWANRVVRVTFSETSLLGYTPDSDDKPAEEIYDTIREIGTTNTRKHFAQRAVAIPRDEDIVAEFNQEKETRGVDGKVRIVTPDKVHIPDMFRVFAVMLHISNPPIPPDTAEFVMPEWGGSGAWRSESVV